MKKHFLLPLIFLILSPPVFCNDTIFSKVVIYRERSYQGSAVSYHVSANDKEITKLKNNSFFVYNCLPGEYDLMINNSKDSKFHLKVQEGKTYYLRFIIRAGGWSGYPGFIQVDSVSAYPVVHNGSMKSLEINAAPTIRPKNRIGLNANLGIGFQNTTMFTTTNGDDANISFGGGVAFGVKYGHEFTKHIDLAVDLNYQFGALRPHLDNAEVTFERTFISITPSYIIPFRGGDAMRLKIGPGIDSYWGPKLVIDGGKVSGGFDDKWKYKNSFGYHINAVFENNFTDKFSFNYGIKWSSVQYEFNSSGNHYPTDKLKKPDGSAIDILFGFYFHF